MKKLLPLAVVAAVIGLYFFMSRETTSWKTVQSSALNLSFLYPVQSSKAADPLAGTVSAVIAYDHIPSGLKDWTISTAAKNAVISTQSCLPLQGTGVYLPIDTAKPMQCGIVTSEAGLVSAYLIGIGRPDGGTAYPESMILTFREENAAMLTKVADFPLAEEGANEKVDTFVDTHPSAVIWPPDDNAKVLYADVEQVVNEVVSTPSQEVIDGLALLKKIAETVTTAL